MSAADELKRLEREIHSKAGGLDAAAPKSRLVAAGEGGKRRSSFDVILVACALLVAGAVGIYWVRQMDGEQSKALQNGLTGGAVGLLVGYSVGRLRP